MLIKYFIPEDGDDQSHPNVFNLDCNAQPTLAAIKKVYFLFTLFIVILL
jgi:hypothetical protein